MNKKHIFLFPIFFILLSISSLYARDSHAIIRGNQPEYAGDSLIFKVYSNMLTFKENDIARCLVEENGDFECIVPLTETRHVFTHLGRYNCYFYASPGNEYAIQLPAKRNKTPEEATDPYFQETSIHLSAKAKTSDADLNFSIRAFNDAFYPYYYKFVINAYGNRVDRKEITKAVEEMRANFDSLEGMFLKIYIDYRIGLLEHYGGQVSNSKISLEYFTGKPVFYYNPAYMELFNEIYKDFFIAFAEQYPGPKLPLVLNREMDYSKASDIIEKESYLKNDTLREMVLLKGLYDGIYDGKNIKSAMIQLLDSLGSNTDIEHHRNAVRDIMLEVTKILPGYEPPDFALYDSDSSLHSLNEMLGNYVYLNFCNSFGYYCVREFEYLRVLHERLKDRLKIVTILVDDDFDNMQELVRTNNYPWVFLSAARQTGVLENYDIRTYPNYFLIGPDGKMVLSPAPAPLENFEQTFNRIYLNQE